MEIDENALILAVNYYPPETGARIKEAQTSDPEGALAMRKEFAASVDEPYTTAYADHVFQAGNSRGLDVVQLSCGQMLIIGDADNILDAQSDLSALYHMSIYTPQALKEKLESSNVAQQQQAPENSEKYVLVVSIFNSEDHAMLQALNDTTGVSSADLHALRTRAGEKFGGLEKLSAQIGDIAAEHKLAYDQSLLAEDEIAFVGSKADIEAAAAAYTEMGLVNDLFSFEEYRGYRQKMAMSAMNYRLDDGDGFDDDGFGIKTGRKAVAPAAFTNITVIT